MSKHLQETDIEALLGSLEPVLDPDTLRAAVEFQEMHKPWGPPCRGPSETQPIEPIPPCGFVLVEEDD